MKKFEIIANKGSENIVTNYVIKEYNPSLPDIMEEFSFLNKMELDIPLDSNLYFFVNNRVSKHDILEYDECIIVTQNETHYYIFKCKYRYSSLNSSSINYCVENLDKLPTKLELLQHMNKAYVLYNYEILQTSLPQVSGTIKRSKI